MSINWSGLGLVFVAGLVAAVLFVALFSFGVSAWSRRGVAVANSVLAVVCFALCVGVVGYGLYAIVAK